MQKVGSNNEGIVVLGGEEEAGVEVGGNHMRMKEIEQGQNLIVLEGHLNQSWIQILNKQIWWCGFRMGITKVRESKPHF